MSLSHLSVLSSLDRTTLTGNEELKAAEAREFVDAMERVDVVAYSPEKPEALILDVDGNLYNNAAYDQHTKTVDKLVIAGFLNQPETEADRVFADTRTRLSEQLGRKARMTETVLELGMTRTHWDEGRANGYKPNNYLQPDPQLVKSFERMLDEYRRVAIASNSPHGSLLPILEALGLPRSILKELKIYGPSTFDISKPDPRYFGSIAENLGIDPQRMVSIGNEHMNDAEPALRNGMGAAIVTGPRDIDHVLSLLQSPDAYQEADLKELAQQYIRPGQNVIVGSVGRAGAGKTTVTRKLADTINQMWNGVPGNRAHVIGLDAFFKLTSAGRAAWLDEPGIEPAERARREDQTTWWDFQKAEEVLRRVQRGEAVHMDGVYNQNDRNAMSGSLHMEPAEGGNVFFLEGVGTPELPADLVAELMYINAHETCREGRVLQRDIAKRGETEAHRRWGMTQGYEGRLYGQKSHYIKGRTVTVIDNSGAQLRKLPKKIPSR